MKLKLTDEEKENYYNRPCETKDCCGLASPESYYCKACNEKKNDKTKLQV